MKLFVMKFICLAVFVSGICILALQYDVEALMEFRQEVVAFLPKTLEGSLDWFWLGHGIGIGMILLGGYGFLPQLKRRKERVITYKGAHGDIVLHLRPIRKVLLKIMRKMPEVYSIKLDVKPDVDGRRACICADVVLKNVAALGARRCAKMVADCLSATARDVLGLEDLSTVRVNVRDVHIDIIATGRQMREQIAIREEEEAAAYALAHPPVASVTLDESSTNNRPDVLADAVIGSSENQIECACLAGASTDVSLTVPTTVGNAFESQEPPVESTTELPTDQFKNAFDSQEPSPDHETQGCISEQPQEPDTTSQVEEEIELCVVEREVIPLPPLTEEEVVEVKSDEDTRDEEAEEIPEAEGITEEILNHDETEPPSSEEPEEEESKEDSY